MRVLWAKSAFFPSTRDAWTEVVSVPGKTAEDFEETLSLVQEVSFVSLFVEVNEQQGRARLAGLVGTRQQALIEGPSKASTGVPLLISDN